jgi:hypothetical protein
VLATTQRLYVYSGGAWVDKTGTVQTATTSQTARFTSIALGTPATPIVIHTNGKDTPAQWNGGGGNFTDMTGAPKWSDVTTIESYIIGIVPPYGLQWGNISSITSWPALNKMQVSDTPDEVIAIAPLGTRGAILYKENTIWGVAFTGGQTAASAFAREFIGYYDGPASPNAVVNLNGAHMYMTTTGRVGFFNGSRHIWVADGLWPDIQLDIDVASSRRCWGVFDPANFEVHFFYPSLGLSNAIRGHVCITLPRPEFGVEAFGAFPGRLGHELSAGATVRLTDKKDIMLVADTTNRRSYKFSTDSTTDNAVAISGYWQTGLIETPGANPLHLESIETFAERANGYGKLTAQLVTSWVLADEGQLSDDSVDIPLGDNEEPTYSDTGFLESRGRFFGLRYSFSSAATNTVRYKGARLYVLKDTS